MVPNCIEARSMNCKIHIFFNAKKKRTKNSAQNKLVCDEITNNLSLQLTFPGINKYILVRNPRNFLRKKILQIQGDIQVKVEYNNF